MLRSRVVSSLAPFALLTLALVSCGGPLTPVSSAPQTSPSSAQIITVNVRPQTSEADLLSRYPGGQVLALHADEGYAQLLLSADALSRPVIGTLSLNAQSLSVAASEPDLLLTAGDTAPASASTASLQTLGLDDPEAQGNSAWAGGNSAWAGGNSAWAGGLSSGPFTTLKENLGLWNLVNLSSGQTMAPALGKGVRVAVLDTGVDLNHPAFAGHLDTASGWDYVGNDNVEQDEPGKSPGLSKAYGHGTAVAGVILQVAPNVTIVPFRVLSPDGSGSLSNIIMAVNDAVKSNVKVINMSLGTVTPSAALNAAITSAIRKGIMVVASSGNSGDENVTYPARSSIEMQVSLGGGLIGVASVNKDDMKSSFSTYGLGIDLLAPGESVATAFPNNQRTNATGTSFAAPIVSGAVALAISAGRTDVIALYKSLKLSAMAPMDFNYMSKLGNGTLNVAKLMVTK
ncbi:S8 family peptidase [Deinococcus sp.]|uniref:S8 family peptidase n=1 Tax=Deinococcus sp. TaxID=47478 RepID=UPI003CC5E81F